MLLAGVIPKEMRQDSEVSHRPSNFKQDFNFLSRVGSEQPHSGAIIHHEIIETVP